MPKLIINGNACSALVARILDAIGSVPGRPDLVHTYVALAALAAIYEHRTPPALVVELKRAAAEFTADMERAGLRG